MNQIILIGFMGAGKTTIGKALAKSLNREFADTDERIEADTGGKSRIYLRKRGSPIFGVWRQKPCRNWRRRGSPG